MVKVVVGIDFENYQKAIALLKALRFEQAEAHLLHVVESIFPDKSFPSLSEGHPMAEVFAEMEERGQAELANAAALIAGSGYVATTERLKGDPARRLIETATRRNADLIAVGAQPKTAWESLFYGSISKALSSSAEQSILVAKSEPKSTEALTAVLATDHSTYCDQSIEKFMSWKAHGVGRLLILTAIEAKAVADAGEWKEMAVDKNQALCDRFSALGIECQSRVTEGRAQQVIASAMKETASDLLIMGARGHGFWDRARLGSVSHFELVASPHNVLVMRV
ncbi:MAG: universal stress protein [Armatimonadetes bacterium]|nr:universal stress protein [Armatimonadota bacterium]